MFKIVLVSIVCAILIIYLKIINKELSNLCIIMSCIIVIFMLLDHFNNVYGFINKLIGLTNLDNAIVKTVFKATSIGFVFEFGANIIEDFGIKSLASKVVFAGKIIILSISIPIFYSLLELIGA